MATRNVMVAFVLACFAQNKAEGAVDAAKPWKWSAKRQNEADAQMVKALAKASGFEYGDAATSSKFSGLCIKKPEGLKPKSERAKLYSRATSALNRAREKFIEPDEGAAMEAYEARLITMLAKLTPRRMDVVVAKAKAKRAGQ